MGFFKDILAAMKEGAEEARVESEQASAAAEEQKQALATQWQAQIMATSAEDIFPVALGAVYRDVFLLELEKAAVEGRPPAHLHLVELPADEVDRVRKLLRRDFDVVDRESAELMLTGLLTDLSDPADFEPDADAVWISRATWVAVAAAGSGLIDLHRARELAEPFLVRARSQYGGWAAYGRHFLEGERSAPGSNPLGRRALRSTVDALLTTPGSPWREVPWPSGVEDGRRFAG